MVTFDAAEPGTTAAQWVASGRLDSLPALRLEGVSGLAVVAAHADDETLGAGGLLADASRLGIPITVVVVTDGAASHPASMGAPGALAAIRSRELHAAIAELAPNAGIIALGFPDGRTDENREEIAAALASSVPSGAWIASPWRGDGHRDHRVVGELCAALAEASGVGLLEYPVWMWHWDQPDDASIPWSQMRSHSLSQSAMTAKSLALRHYVSQTTERDSGDRALLSADFLEHFARDAECFVVTEPALDHHTPGQGREQASKSERYFDDLYERNPDPWRLSTRWYETRKREISIASLPRARYATALEIGCSVGELTALIADRADAVLGLDISRAAVDAARARTRDQPGVTILHRDATRDFPDGEFDLIVLSEVGYYWDLQTLRSMLGRIALRLAGGGTLLACHWRHPVSDYPLTGDQVHEELAAIPALHRLATHVEEDFVLEIFATTPASVATQEGLVP